MALQLAYLVQFVILQLAMFVDIPKQEASQSRHDIQSMLLPKWTDSKDDGPEETSPLVPLPNRQDTPAPSLDSVAEPVMSNILPKKLWHVGRAENIERVQRDKEKERIIKEKQADEQAHSERMDRLAILRRRAQSKVVTLDATTSIGGGTGKEIAQNADRLTIGDDLRKPSWYQSSHGAFEDSDKSGTLLRKRPATDDQE